MNEDNLDFLECAGISLLILLILRIAVCQTGYWRREQLTVSLERLQYRRGSVSEKTLGSYVTERL